jgi:putative spermidine/putrescine transport system ATP-binding protein
MTLLGPSGSGKTTALNLLAGFSDPTSGEVLIDGAEISRVPTEKRNIGMVFQNYSLFPHRNILGNVGFPLEMRGVSRSEIRRRSMEALEMVRLAEFAHRMPHEISGGQKQRAAFARALVFNPRVLLMDEPLGALDLKLREALQLEIKQYQREINCSVLFVTHDQGEALTLSDRLAVMNEGHILQIGTPRELYDRPGSHFVAQFIGNNNLMRVEAAAGDRARLQGLGEVGLKPGMRAGDYAALRPELLSFADGSAGGRRKMAGPEVEVIDAVFFGNSVRYALRAPDGYELAMVQTRRPDEAPLATGNRQSIFFDDQELVCMSA